MKIVPNDKVPDQHPKLKMAHLEILEILKKHDISGVAVLHTPGHMEMVQYIEPTFSCVKINAKRQLQINAPIIDPENPEVAKKKIADTINMVANMRKNITDLARVFTQADVAVRQHFGMMPKIQPGPPPERKN